MSEALDIVARCGIFDETRADKLRAFEEGLELLITERGWDSEDPLVIEIRRLISEQIVAVEIGSGYLVIGPEGKVFRVTKEE
jgi:hypothetical protein